MVAMIWKLVKIWVGKFIELLYKLFKAQLRAFLWKYGLMAVMLVGTVLLAIFVLR